MERVLEPSLFIIHCWSAATRWFRRISFGVKRDFAASFAGPNSNLFPKFFHFFTPPSKIATFLNPNRSNIHPKSILLLPGSIFGTIGPFWHHLGTSWASFWEPLAHFGFIFGTLFMYCSGNFDTSWCPFGSILGTLSIWTNPFSNCACTHNSVETHAELCGIRARLCVNISAQMILLRFRPAFILKRVRPKLCMHNSANTTYAKSLHVQLYWIFAKNTEKL